MPVFFKTMAARGLVNGRGPLRRSGRDLVLKNIGIQMELPDKFDRFLDQRMHVGVVLDEWNHLAVVCEEFLKLP